MSSIWLPVILEQPSRNSVACKLIGEIEELCVRLSRRACSVEHTVVQKIEISLIGSSHRPHSSSRCTDLMCVCLPFTPFVVSFPFKFRCLGSFSRLFSTPQIYLSLIFSLLLLSHAAPSDETSCREYSLRPHLLGEATAVSGVTRTSFFLLLLRRCATQLTILLPLPSYDDYFPTAGRAC